MLIKKCKHCGVEYTCSSQLQTTCSYHCWQYEVERKKKRKDQKKLDYHMSYIKPKVEKLVGWSVISKAYKKEFEKKYGELYCCECRTRFPSWWEVHHIIYRSQLRKNPDVHNPRNLLLLCNGCHIEIHKNKEMRIKWVRKRKLWEIYKVAEKYKP